MLIMLDKRQRIIMPAVKVQEEIFRSMKVESGSKTPYTDATQVSSTLSPSDSVGYLTVDSTQLAAIS